MFWTKSRKIKQQQSTIETQSKEIESLKSDVNILEREVARLKNKYEPSSVAARVPSKATNSHSAGGNNRDAPNSFAIDTYSEEHLTNNRDPNVHNEPLNSCIESDEYET
ncbi:hypothetical protein [Vibrio harveyi]|uniref:hypothetical protein n=1 Tax=Vibrio harveyi TaxID=669 RepID=UPI003CF0A4F1